MAQQSEQSSAEQWGIQWDTEERHELGEKEGRVRETTMYLTLALLAWMDQVWGGITKFVRTSTNVDTAEVSVGKAKKGDPGAVELRRLGAQNVAEFSFWRPLKKLDLKVPEDRQFNVTPFTREVEGVGTVFVFPLAKRVSVPRNLKEEAEAEVAVKAAAGKQPPEAPPQAQEGEEAQA